jgi:NhaA family Na+:H+ antiporter
MADTNSDLQDSGPSSLEKGFKHVITPFQMFIRDQRSGSVLLLLCTLIALGLANSPLSGAYQNVIEAKAGLVFAGASFEMSLRHWVNDGLLSLFFFVLGLEIKRELLVGELREPARSLPVLVAALAGMLVPALLFYALNRETATIHGWAIPMATDTAFAIGVLGLLGRRVPSGLTAFLLALAIIDDMGAVLVIALFYAHDISVPHLLAAAVMLGALTLTNLLGVRRPLVYLAGGGLVWLAVLGSGVHATVAGVLVAATVPARTKLSPRFFLRRSRRLINEFEAIERRSESPPILAEPEKHSVVERLQETAEKATTPLQLWERALEHPVALLVLPLFALANAGIEVEPGTLPTLLLDPLAAGIVLGLVIGKAAGIGLASSAVLLLGRGRLPGGMSLYHTIGVGLLGGMGFTMSIFIAALGFGEDPDQLVTAKTGVLVASLIAGICGYLWLRLGSRRPISR